MDGSVGSKRKSEIDTGNLLHRRLRSRQPSQPTKSDDDELPSSSEFTSFPIRKPRVEEERYQAKIPKLMSRSTVAQTMRPKLNVVWNGMTTQLSQAEVDGYLQFCRLLTGQSMGEEVIGGEGLTPREQDENCLEYLHKCGDDVAKAKFLLLSNMGAGTEVLLTQLHYNKLEEKIQRKLAHTANGSVRPNSSQPVDQEKLKVKLKPGSSNGNASEAAVGSKKVNWKKWVARAKNVCSGKTAAPRETLYIMVEEIAAADAVPEHAVSTLKALQAKLESVDDWIAQAHDAVSQVKPDGRWTLTELRTLVNKKPKGVKLAEEVELQKLLQEWTFLKDKIDLAVHPNPAEEPLQTLIALHHAAVQLPLDLGACIEQLSQRIAHAQTIAETISASLPRTLRWKPPSSAAAAAITPLWTRRSTAELEALRAKAEQCGVSFFEREVIDFYLKKAEAWRRSAKAALAKNSNVRELVSLLKRADTIPIDLSEEKRLFDEQIKAAQGWLKKVKGAVPRVGKTRETANAKKMDLDTLRTFRDEASTLGMDLTEANHISQVVLSAEDWQRRVKELTLQSRGDDADAEARLTELRELLDEGEQVPVRMEHEMQILQVEVSMLEWEQKLRSALEGRPNKVGIEHFETMLQDFLKLRKLLPASIKNRGNWKADKERLVRRTLSNARDWLRKAHVLAVRDPQSWLALSSTRQRELINDKASLLGDHFTLDKLGGLVEKAQDLPVDLSAEIAPLNELKVLVESKRKRVRALVIATEQPEASEFVGENTEATAELCKGLLEEGTTKTSIKALERELSLASSTGVYAEEFDILRQTLDRAEDWMQHFYAVFESAARVDKKRKRDDALGPVSVESVQGLLDRASKLAIDVRDQVEQLSHALEAVSEWRTSAQQLLADYTRSLKQAPITADNQSIAMADEMQVDVAAGVEAEATPASASASAATFRRELQPTAEELAYFEKFMASLSLPNAGGSEASRVDDFAAEAHTMKAAETVSGMPWTEELAGVMERVAGFVRETRRKSISRIVLPLSEYKYCLWVLRGKAWCAKAAGCISCHKIMRIEELKRFVAEGTQFIMRGMNAADRKADATVVSTRTSKRMRSSVANEVKGQNGTVGEGEDPGAAPTPTAAPAPTATEGEGEEASAGDSEGADEVSAAEVEGTDFASFNGLGHAVQTHLVVLERWARRALQWQRVSKTFMRTEAKSYSFGRGLKALLKLKHDLGLNVAVDEEKQMRSELKRARAWLEKAQAALHGAPTSEQIESLLHEGGKLKCGLPEYKQLKETLRQGKAWLSEVKLSGIEKGEASVEQLQQLLEDSKTIKMDLGKHTAILQQATKLYCLCRAPFDGLMIACDKCEDWYHTSCVNITQKALRKIGKYTCPTCQVKRVLAVQRSLARTTLFKVTLIATAPNKHPLVERYARWISSTFTGVFEQPRQEVDVPALKRTLQEGPGTDLASSAFGASFLAILRRVLWCSNAIRRLRQKSSIDVLHELLADAPRELESAKGVIELLQGIADRGAAWIMRAKAVLDSPVETSKHKILNECRLLLRQSVHLPLALKEEKLLSACVDDEAARYCLCKGFNDGGFMIGCDKCEDWFHGKCVNLTKEVGDTLSSWTCPGCRPENVVKDVKAPVENGNTLVHPSPDLQSSEEPAQASANGVVPTPTVESSSVSMVISPKSNGAPIVVDSDTSKAPEQSLTLALNPAPATTTLTLEGEKASVETPSKDTLEADGAVEVAPSSEDPAMGHVNTVARTEQTLMNGQHKTVGTSDVVHEASKAVVSSTIENKTVADSSMKQGADESIQTEVDKTVGTSDVVHEASKAVVSSTIENKTVADSSVKQGADESIQTEVDKMASKQVEGSSETDVVDVSTTAQVGMNGKHSA